jgi:hypothetical protein
MATFLGFDGRKAMADTMMRRVFNHERAQRGVPD